jgi:hypothetical protein
LKYSLRHLLIALNQYRSNPFDEHHTSCAIFCIHNIHGIRQYIRSQLEEILNGYQQRTLIHGGKEVPDALPSGMRVFNRPRTMRQVLYRDLAFADIQAVKEKGQPIADDHDIHALRKTTGSLMARAGVKPQQATKIPRHSSQAMTWKHYTNLELIDSHQAVNMLPDFNSDQNRESGKKSGTDDVELETENKGVLKGAQPSGFL